MSHIDMHSKRMVLKVHPWVIWWFCLGLLGGAIALPNILPGT